MPITHEWNGTVLTITSDSGTSSCDLKGDKGDTGVRGVQGIAGEKGDTGKGEKGDKGDAFTYDDFTAEQLEALRGPEGVAGKDGLDGEKGDTGAAGKDGRDGYIHNILDNANFINPVNQRGSTSYSGVGYTIDRWVGMSRTSVVVGSGGIEISNLSPTVDGCYIQQIIPNEVFYTDALTIGNTHTIAIKVNGTIYSAAGVIGNQITASHGNGNAIFMYSPTFESYVVRITLNKGFEGSIIIEWVALYQGDYTADTLPKYQPKGYATELIECQRYFLKTNGHGYGYPSSTTVARLNIPIPTTMRITPTIETGRTFTIRNNGSSATSTDYSVNSMKDNCIQLTINTSGLTTNHALIGYADSEFSLSADL